jgi:hypothetical protein
MAGSSWNKLKSRRLSLKRQERRSRPLLNLKLRRNHLYQRHLLLRTRPPPRDLQKRPPRRNRRRLAVALIPFLHLPPVLLRCQLRLSHESTSKRRQPVRVRVLLQVAQALRLHQLKQPLISSLYRSSRTNFDVSICYIIMCQADPIHRSSPVYVSTPHIDSPAINRFDRTCRGG